MTKETLETLRQYIDEIDEKLLSLLGERFAVSQRIFHLKKASPLSPLRPAREAVILRHLQAIKPKNLSPSLLFALWRVILSASAFQQAPLSLWCSEATSKSGLLRSLLATHYPIFPFSFAASAQDAFKKALAEPCNLCALSVPEIGEFEPAFFESSLCLIGGLGAHSLTSLPQLFLFGHCPIEPTGEDVSLFVTMFPLTSSFQATNLLWKHPLGQTQSLLCFRGFYDTPPILEAEAGQARFLWKKAGGYPLLPQL